MRPFTLLIKPTGPDCNLACKYCFYSGKTSIFGPGEHRMSDKVLRKLISDYMKLGFKISSFAWQGGEPTLMGLSFFKKVVALQKEYGWPGQVVSNAIQTNGILLDDQWCKFLGEYKFLIGISLDGPAELHDYYRRDRTGAGSFNKVAAAVATCREQKVEFNILTLLNNKNVTEADRLFDFFVDNNVKYLQFIPCIEKDLVTGGIADFSITPKQYGDFLCKIFDRWLEYGPEKISIRIFDSILSYYLSGRHTACTFAQKCDDYIVVEHNGDVFCCDFFVEDKYKLGNILEEPIEELAGSKTKRAFARDKQNLCNKCFVCRYNDICCGGCPKHRLAANNSYEHESYFCESYRQFFDYALAKFMQVAAKLSSGRMANRQAD